MGAWGPGIFQNDTAIEWIGNLSRSDDFSAIPTSLKMAFESAEASICDSISCKALAAAEVIASWRGHPPVNGQELEKWTSRHSTSFNPELVELAQKVVTSIKNKSETRELWTDRQGIVRAEWLNAIDDLQHRLRN